MNFDFSNDQKMMQDQIQRFLQDKCPLSRVRAVLESDETYASDIWQGLCDLGVAGSAIPEAYGGLGLGALELCVIAEELGRAVAPVPFSSSIYMAAEAIRLYGDETLKQNWLPKLASGAAIGTLAVSEGIETPAPQTIDSIFSKSTITGKKLPVADAMDADVALVLAKSDKGIALVAVDLTGAGVTREAVKTIDPTRAHGVITFDNAPATLVGEDGEGWTYYNRIETGAAVLMAFEQIGGAQAAMNMAKDYALERYAFGRQIGSYQAIKHRLADMYAKIELARSNSYYAAMMLAEDGTDLDIAAAAARVAASEAYRFAAQENIQIHGGIGFTWEADTQFHYRRSKLLELALGSVMRWKDRLVHVLEKANAV